MRSDSILQVALGQERVYLLGCECRAHQLEDFTLQLRSLLGLSALLNDGYQISQDHGHVSRHCPHELKVTIIFLPEFETTSISDSITANR